MHLVRAILVRKDPSACDEHDVARLIDALWAHCTDQDALEHVHGRSSRAGVDLVLFFRESPGTNPQRAAAELIDRVYRGSASARTLFEPCGEYQALA